MSCSLSRRTFLAACPAALLAADLPKLPEYRRGGMSYRPLGHTGMHVSLLAFGSHTDPADRLPGGPNRTVLSPAGQARRDRIITRAFDYGVNLLDVYETEGQWEPVARLLQGRRDKVLVSLAHDVTPADIDRACRLFGHIDLYRFHTADIDGPALQNWDVLRKAKEAGKIRAIGIATHIERTMTMAVDELEGIDYLFFPYNFIHARADYGEFLPRAARRGIGLIGMKPLASGSIMKLDPKARPGAKPEYEELLVWHSKHNAILPAAVAELTKALDRMPDETLCMAAMRFVFGQPFLSTAIAGMFQEELLEDNHRALTRYQQSGGGDRAALDAARRLAGLLGPRWLPDHYRWLEDQWRA